MEKVVPSSGMAPQTSHSIAKEDGVAWIHSKTPNQGKQNKEGESRYVLTSISSPCLAEMQLVLY